MNESDILQKYSYLHFILAEKSHNSGKSLNFVTEKFSLVNSIFIDFENCFLINYYTFFTQREGATWGTVQKRFG